MTTATDKRDWVQDIGEPSYGSIVEMVDALSRERSAELFAEKLSAAQLRAIIRADMGEKVSKGETLAELRQRVADALQEDAISPDGWEFDEEAARERIQEDALSVEVRSPWYSPGAEDYDRKPSEFCLLLTTGGPAVRIIGDLNEYGEPTRARLEVQDWFKPWTEYVPADGEVLLAYARCFWFGE